MQKLYNVHVKYIFHAKNYCYFFYRYTLMTTCWNLTPNERPTFEPCLIVLKATMNTMVMEIENNSYECKYNYIMS